MGCAKDNSYLRKFCFPAGISDIKLPSAFPVKGIGLAVVEVVTVAVYELVYVPTAIGVGANVLMT